MCGLIKYVFLSEACPLYQVVVRETALTEIDARQD